MRFNNYNKNKEHKEKKEIQHCEYIGQFLTLSAKRFNEHGVYLGNDNIKDQILLPGKEQPNGLKAGDELRVFIYRDSSDRPIATVREPYVTINKVAALEVAQITKIGAFLDWGLEKQLFLPFHEMTGKVKVHEKILVTLYVDKSERLCATQKHLYSLLSTNSPYQGGETVSGRVYEFSKNFGTFIAVDDRYSAMLPASEDTRDLSIGDVIEVHVKGVKEDGKLDVSRRGKAHEEIDADSIKILSLIQSYGGVLPFSDNASPERIKEETGLSKAAFKRAAGHLYKERKIIIEKDSIRIL